MTDLEIIQLLGGVTAVARMLKIKPPSVQGWLTSGIPEGRLIELAAQIEIRSKGRFSRKERWPDNFAFYWPELAKAPESIAQPATETVAFEKIPPAPVGALRMGTVRRHGTRRVKDLPREGDRRRQKGPPFQSPETGVA